MVFTFNPWENDCRKKQHSQVFFLIALQRQNDENWKQIFPEKEYRGLSPNFNYIFPRWVCLFCWRKYVDRSWEYINRSQTHECGNWGWGCAIPRKGIYKQNCRCSVEHVLLYRALSGWKIYHEVKLSFQTDHLSHLNQLRICISKSQLKL
jgi:hypothetical protein